MTKASENRPSAVAAAALAGAARVRNNKAFLARLSQPKAPGAEARQKSAVQPAAGLKPAKPAKKRRTWPILEVALVLVLVKIAAGAFYIWNRPGETGWSGLSALSQGRPAEPEFGLGGAETWPEAVELPEADQPSEAMAGLPPETVADKPAETVLADYLAAALEATQPAPAGAAPAYAAPAVVPASATAAAGALSAGALMVLGGQNAAARTAENIPLPPGEEELLQPAAQLPPASLPRIGTDGAAPATRADFESLRKVREREQELARREALLTSRAGALGALETGLNQRLKEAEAVKKEAEGLLQRNEAVLAEQQALAEQQKKEDEALKDVRLKHLVTAYTGMKPEQAGSLINSMDDDVAVAILSAMPGNKAGKIMAMVNPDKAARLTKAISEKRIDPNMLLNEEDEDQAGGALGP